MLLEDVLNRYFHTRIHPSIPNGYYPSIHFWAFQPVFTIAFRHCNYNFKIGALRIVSWDDTFAGYWETVVDCVENIEKRQQWLIWPKNCLRTHLWFNQNIHSSIKKVAMTAPSRGSLWYLQWITAMDNIGQEWITMDNNGKHWTTTDNNGKHWITMDNNKQQWTTMYNNGQQHVMAYQCQMSWHIKCQMSWHINVDLVRSR